MKIDLFVERLGPTHYYIWADKFGRFVHYTYMGYTKREALKRFRQWFASLKD